MKLCCIALLFLTAAYADGAGRISSKQATADAEITADPSSSFWKGVKGVRFGTDPFGKPVPGHETEVRSRWTGRNLYVLFIAPYQELYVNEQPDTTQETNKLWDHDVCEVFAGSNFETIGAYKEFQVSPLGEFVDLDINRYEPKSALGLKWNSSYRVKARIDREKKVWYGEMQIPLESFELKEVKPGAELRINFYRMQGPPPNRLKITWQPTNSPSFHVPESFGRLVLER
ncbi:MAG TPA: carbohydrate-binding family 9-like protein [Bryobacteraceae bacterium]|nr:carbohydrate-binding family 9-like protein [Bryobacteraceae bacterium]